MGAPRRTHPEIGRFVATCGSGWFPLVEQFVDDAKARLPAGAQLEVVRAQEKWGLLSLDYRVEPHLSESYRGVMNAAGRAASASARTCEICGRSGRLQDLGGLLATRCDRHVEAMKLMYGVKNCAASPCVSSEEQDEKESAAPSGAPEVQPWPSEVQTSGSRIRTMSLPKGRPDT